MGRYEDDMWEKLMAYLPGLTGDIYYNIRKSGKNPRYPTVFKLVKEDLLRKGIDYKKLDEDAKYDIEDMVRDTFYGIKEGE